MMHRIVAAIPIATVKADKWPETPAQMKSSAAEYMGCRINRYGPRVITEVPPGAAVTRKVPFLNEIRAQTFSNTAAT